MDLEANLQQIKEAVIQQRQQREERMEDLATNPNFDRLRHFTNWDRFIPGIKFSGEEANCPHCQMLMLEDRWPPNYCGGNSFYVEGGSWIHEDDGTIKYICLDCKQEIHIYQYRKMIGGEVIEKMERVVYDMPLTERNDKLLTKHDVWREDYYEEHGEYPKESYG